MYIIIHELTRFVNVNAVEYMLAAFMLSFASSHSFAQSQTATELVQQMTEEMAADGLLTEDAEEEVAELISLSDNKIDLNNATAEQLSQLFFLTDKQQRQIILSRELYGPFRSESELLTLYGFSFYDVYRLLQFAYVGDNGGAHPVRQRSTFQLTARVQRLFPEMKGFKAKNDSTAAPFLGNAFKKYMRAELSAGSRVQGGFVAESDAGEPTFSHGVSLTDFLGGYLQVNMSSSPIRSKALLGHYSARFGQGLGLWTGFSTDVSSVQSSVRRFGNRLSGTLSASESGYLRGAAVSLSHSRVQADVFFSLTDNDASLTSQNDSLDTELSVTSVRTDGYHRTTGELARRNNFQQTLFGGYLKFSGQKSFCALGFNQWSGSSPLGSKGELYKLFYPTSKQMTTVHMDYSSDVGRCSLYGELAYQTTGSWGVVQGVDIDFGLENSLSVAVRSIGKKYYSVYQNPFSRSTQPGGECGAYIGINVYPLHNVTVLANVDVYRHVWLRYQKPAPTNGFKARMKSTYTIDDCNEVVLRLTMDNYDDSDLDDRKRLERTSRMDAKLVWTAFRDQTVSFHTSAERVHYAQDNHKSHGFWIGEQVKLKSPGDKATLDLLLAHFDTDDYYSRIYTMLPDVLYSLSMPSYSGKGVLAVTKARWSPSRSFSMWLWGSYVKYYDRTVIGSGNNQTEGSHRFDTKMQVKVKLYRTKSRKTIYGKV